MKILISSYSFYPNTGGIESVSLMLASEFSKAGNEVKVITLTKSNEEEKFPFQVIRQPNLKHLIDLVGWSDVYFQSNISLQLAWPLLFIRRPWVITHHIDISRLDGRLSWKDHLKRFFTRFAICISVSKVVSGCMSTPSIVIKNPYNDSVFKRVPNELHPREIVFLGRLIQCKGVDVLLRAIKLLQTSGLYPNLTIIGIGPQLSNLRQLVEELKLENQVTFAGLKTGLELVKLLNAHQIMVVPSRVEESFGLVVLEGIACGCVVIGSEKGGIPDTIGPCGVVFPSEKYQVLAKILADFLLNPDKLEAYRIKAEQHLSNHKGSVVAMQYLKVMKGCLNSRHTGLRIKIVSRALSHWHR